MNKVIEKMTFVNNRKTFYKSKELIEKDGWIDQKKKESILSKYEWLKEYHNEKCKEFNYPELVID